MWVKFLCCKNCFLKMPPIIWKDTQPKSETNRKNYIFNNKNQI